MMRASIGKAVIEMAAPMNKVASNAVTVGANRPSIVISHGARRTAARKGAAIPEMETAAALLPWMRKWLRSKPSPTRNM